MNTQTTSRIILALDVDSVEKAVQLMDATKDHIGMVKIGLELINAQLAGEVAKAAHARSVGIFWDGKWDDIPTTAGNAMKVTAQMPGICMVNVHVNADIEGMMAVVANKGNALVLAVTELTSLDTESVELKAGASRNASVLYDARMAAYAGCDGVICSPKELSLLGRYANRKINPELPLTKLIKVVPGTRSLGGDAQDQKNVDSQESAILNGADWLVIGREVTKNPNMSPAEAARALNVRMAIAFAEREKGAVAK